MHVRDASGVNGGAEEVESCFGKIDGGGFAFWLVGLVRAVAARNSDSLIREESLGDLVVNPVKCLAPLRRARQTSLQELPGRERVEHSWALLIADARTLLTGGSQESRIGRKSRGN